MKDEESREYSLMEFTDMVKLNFARNILSDIRNYVFDDHSKPEIERYIAKYEHHIETIMLRISRKEKLSQEDEDFIGDYSYGNGDRNKQEPSENRSTNSGW